MPDSIQITYRAFRRVYLWVCWIIGLSEAAVLGASIMMAYEVSMGPFVAAMLIAGSIVALLVFCWPGLSLWKREMRAIAKGAECDPERSTLGAVILVCSFVANICFTLYALSQTYGVEFIAIEP